MCRRKRFFFFFFGKSQGWRFGWEGLIGKMAVQTNPKKSRNWIGSLEFRAAVQMKLSISANNTDQQASNVVCLHSSWSQSFFSSCFQCLLLEATLHSSIALPVPHGSPYGIKFVCGLQPESLPCILSGFLNEQVMEHHGSLWQPAMCWWEHVKDRGARWTFWTTTGRCCQLKCWRKLSWCLSLGVWRCSSWVEQLIIVWLGSDGVMRAADEEVACWWHLLPPAPKQDVPQMTGWMLFDLFIFCLFVILSRSQIVIHSVFVSKNQAHVRNSHRISWTPVWVCCHWSITGRTTWDFFFLFLGD